MKQISFQKIRQEPIISGIVVGFITLCAIAFVSLFDKLFLHSDTAPSAFTFALAIIAALTTGGIATVRSKKVIDRRNIELQMARSLAIGDFSKTIVMTDSHRSDLTNTLTEIADRQLTIERDNGQLIQEVAARESLLLAALDCVNKEIVVFDKSGLLVCANAAYFSKCNSMEAVIALGMTRKEVFAEIAKAPKSNLPLNERQSWLNAQDDMRLEALKSKTPIRFVRLNNEIAQLSVHSIKDGHRVEIIENFGQVAALEQRAEKAEREAHAMARLKQVTLSRLSHTIRTPMTGVLAAAELLSNTKLDQKQHARLDIIRRASSTLLGVVQDMFELADRDVEPLVAPVQKLDNVPKHALVCSTPTHMAQETKALLYDANFEVTVFDAFNEQVGAQETWFLANEKQASLIVCSDAAQKNQILNTISAINLKQRPDLKLFSELINLTKSTESESQSSPACDVPVPNQSALKPELDVLIVESNEVNQISLSNALRDCGFAYKIVGTGMLAIETAKQCKPRLILLDISIPDINGLQVAAAIRKYTPNTAQASVIIGMANHFVKGDMPKCINAGMDEYRAKPQSATELLNLLQTWLKPEPLKMVG